MQIQERIIANHIRAATLKVMAGYGCSAVFGILAFVLIMYGPTDRATASNIFSAAFLDQVCSAVPL
jgi:hypothetical protein